MQNYKDIQRWIANGYALELVGVIKKDDPRDELDTETLTEEFQALALQNLEEREDTEFDPRLTDEQLLGAIDVAAKAAISRTLDALSDKEMIQTSIREDGEMVLSLTAKGQAFSDMLEDGFIKPDDFTKNFNEGKYD